MSKEGDVLVASGNFEHRRSLVRILEELQLNVISVSTFHQAEEVLSRQRITLLFSDQRLPDGSYRDLLNHAHSLERLLLTAGRLASPLTRCCASPHSARVLCGTPWR